MKLSKQLLLGLALIGLIIIAVLNRKTFQTRIIGRFCPAPTSTTKGIEFRTGLEGNYRENLVLLIATARRTADSDPHSQDALTALDDNTWDLGYFLQNFYGLTSGQKFTALFQEQDKAFLDYALASKNHDDNAKAGAQAEIQTSIDDRVSFWKGLIPNLDTARHRRTLTSLSDSVRSSIDAYTNLDIAKSYKEQHSAYQQTGQLADQLADIITQQQPEKFGQ